jgi:hypothetical protein
MPEYNGNDIHIQMNAVDVGARWRSFEMTLNIGDENVSAGAGIDWEKHASKLKNISATLTLVYDDTAAANNIAALATANDIVAIVYGPEGNATGKPKHEQSFKVNSVEGPSTNHDKTLVVLTYSLISSGVPTSNIYAGDTF